MEDRVKQLESELSRLTSIYKACSRELNSANRLLDEYRTNYDLLLEKLDRLEELEDIVKELQCDL